MYQCPKYQDDPVYSEAKFHLQFAWAKVRSFVGRESIIGDLNSPWKLV